MARPQAANYDAVRREILARSADVFARKGYAGTSIADLAAGNGISRGLLYHYFASKEAILSEMLNTHLDAMLADVHAAATGPGNAEARFRATVRTMVRINARSKALQVVLLTDLPNLGDTERETIVGKQRAILSVFRALIAEIDGGRRLNADTLKAQTMMFIGMINYTYIWYDADGPVGPDAYADMAADTFLCGLRAGTPGCT